MCLGRGLMKVFGATDGGGRGEANRIGRSFVSSSLS